MSSFISSAYHERRAAGEKQENLTPQPQINLRQLVGQAVDLIKHHVMAGAEYLRQILVGHGVDRNTERMHAALGEQDRLTPGRKSTVREHNIEGSPGTQIIPELYRPGDYVIDNKKRLDCFYGTDLRQLLDTLGVKNVARCLGWVITNEQFFEKVRGGGTAAGH